MLTLRLRRGGGFLLTVCACGAGLSFLIYLVTPYPAAAPAMRVRVDPGVATSWRADHAAPPAFYFSALPVAGIASTTVTAAVEPEAPAPNPWLRGAAARALHGGGFAKVLQALGRSTTPQTMATAQRLSRGLAYQLAPFGMVADTACSGGHCAIAIARVPADQLGLVSRAIQAVLPANAMSAVVESGEGQREIRYWLADVDESP